MKINLMLQNMKRAQESSSMTKLLVDIGWGKRKSKRHCVILVTRIFFGIFVWSQSGYHPLGRFNQIWL